ncbi:uncharacterized protein [Rutidosis leptorrhynchoides]|uniref:uncharacterized protein n=1 Tax=Rutidosis leptorrhynchoides TaxID=125765 RepID=UPI003A992B85
MRCVGPTEAEMIIEEVHGGSCAPHSGSKTIASKIMRMSYFRPTLHAPQNRKSRHDMIPVNSPWPFYKWAIDIVGPFPAGAGNVKFLFVAIDYFTKWVEAKALRTITGVQLRTRKLIGCAKLLTATFSSSKKRLNEKRTGWVDELSDVLWAHRTTFKKSTGETPFSLVPGSEAMIPAEILVPTHMVAIIR